MGRPFTLLRCLIHHFRFSWLCALKTTTTIDLGGEELCLSGLVDSAAELVKLPGETFHSLSASLFSEEA